MANNSSGARSVLYGKTIDHVIEQEVVLSDGSVVQFRAAQQPTNCNTTCAGDSLEAECYRTVQRIGARVRRRSRADDFPKCCAASAATISTSSPVRTNRSILPS